MLHYLSSTSAYLYCLPGPAPNLDYIVFDFQQLYMTEVSNYKAEH